MRLVHKRTTLYLTTYVQACTIKYMEITISEFRKNIKGYFDSALQNEVVCIERGGVHYNLTARLPDGSYTLENPPQVINKLPTATPTTLEEANDPESPGYSAKVSPILINTPEDVKKVFPEAKAMGFCKNGHPIPEGRTKCMGKGCKYS